MDGWMVLFVPSLPLCLQVQVDPVHRVVLGVQGGLALPLVLSHLLVPEQRERDGFMSNRIIKHEMGYFYSFIYFICRFTQIEFDLKYWT